jgi:hypothetical protein
LAPPCIEDPALLLFEMIYIAQVLTSKVRCQCPSFSILHDPSLIVLSQQMPVTRP